jgi:methylenetetrahydrofolate dehydrogenase (NADP+)/methenyltetrahydrofolate cyclohydrolase
LIERDYLKPEHKIVLDAGFVPQADGQILGDVAKDAYDIPQNLTPVPGGIGPTQMAVLLERMVRMAGIEIEPWDYKKFKNNSI